jgi:hypothetical protein
MNADMLHFISKIVLGEADDTVHWRLIKYSKGDFEGGVIEAKVKASSVTLGGSPEYEDLIGSLLAELAPDQLEFKISGTIRCSKDQSALLGNIGLGVQMKRAKGKERYEAKLIDKSANAKMLREAYSKLMGECNILLTVKPTSGGKEWSMSTKKDYPRPSTKGELKAPDIDFCKAVLSSSEDLIKRVFSAILPDLRNDTQTSFKQLRVANMYRISEIVLPENREKLGYNEIRTMAKRKGVLTRKISIDGKEVTKEIQFCV